LQTAVTPPLSVAPPGLDVAALRRDWAAAKLALLDGRKPTGDPQPLLAALAKRADSIVIEVWKSVGMPASMALMAVGGYGRGELFPYSDVDVLIVIKAPPGDEQRAQIERFVGALWDIGMELGHSVRTLAECVSEADNDVTVQTALIEARYITGSRGLAKQVSLTIANSLDPQQFFRAKSLEMRQRHQKFQDTPYALEPNVKEAPGGLRDLHIILWVARAAGLGTSFADLATNGIITESEARRITRNERFLKRVRIALHAVTGRREDRLVFDLQTPLAEYFGFKPKESSEQPRRASEYLMQAYYWAAKAVTQLNRIVLQNIERVLFQTEGSEPVPLDDEFCIRDGRLDLTHPDVFIKRPSAMLDVFWIFAQHPEAKELAAPLQRALADSRSKIDAQFRKDPANRERFMDILQQPVGITRVFRAMNQTSVLGRYLPAFRKIVGQMQHDLFHVYTVDQHILMVLRNVRRFMMADHAHEYPFCSALIANFDKPWLLYIAALFHDIAKGRGGDHSVLGMADARRFCRDHGLSREETSLVVFLVEHHLTMSKTAQKQDINDADVVRAFAKLVKSERRLTALYLLTVADIRGTSPKVWNAWKGKLLEDLYRATRRVLGGEKIDPSAELEARKQEALRILRLYAFPDHAQEAFWNTLDVAFFLRNDPQDIAWHTRTLASRCGSPQPIVRARLAPVGEGLQVMVYAPDQPDLFARICGYFDSTGFNILDARIHTTRLPDGSRHALDTFIVSDEGRSHHYRDIMSLLEVQLTARITERAPLTDAPRGRLSRKSRTFPIPPAVEWRPDERGQFGLLAITSADRAGLLYTIAQLFSQYHVNVHMAKIMTLGERAEDSFLVDGPILTDPKMQLQLEQDLMDALSA
jgi:[protein-PII] uridylyltransferase